MSNHAIAVRLKGARPPDRPALARALVDFGVQVHVGEKAGADSTAVVAEITIGGRPQGLFGAKHRSHTTAWVVFVDIVRTTIANQPLPVAIRRVKTLIQDARILPGAAPSRLKALSGAAQVQPRTGPAVTGRGIYDRADAEATAAIQVAEGMLGNPADAGKLVAALQDLVAAYLQLRNATPLSVAHDVDRAGGHGEGTARGDLVGDEAEEEAPKDARDDVATELSAAEDGAVRLDKPGARARLWKLLDLAAVHHLAKTEPPQGAPAYSTAPGTIAGESPAQRYAAAVAQHLLSVRRAYPRLYALAEMTSDESLVGALGDVAGMAGPGGFGVAELVRDRLTRVPGLPDAGSAAGVTAPKIAPRGTAQLVLGTDATGRTTLATLRLGTRPPGLLGNEEGAHLTAFGLVAQGLKTSLEGKPLDELPATLEALVATARGLATAPRVNALRGDPKRFYELASAQADATLAAVQASDPQDPAFVGHLQELVVAYLWLRNSLPLTAVSEGGVPAGKAEGRMLERLRQAERAYATGGEVDDRAVLDDLWGLLDATALDSVLKSVAPLAAPGIRSRSISNEPKRRVGDVVRTHLDTAEAAFPLCVGSTLMRLSEVVEQFLEGDLPREDVRDTESARRRQDESLALAPADAAAVATYISSGQFPAPKVRRARPNPQRRQSTRAPQPLKRDREWLDEDDFDDQEEEYTQEAEAIDRSGAPPRKKRQRREVVTTT